MAMSLAERKFNEGKQPPKKKEKKQKKKGKLLGAN